MTDLSPTAFAKQAWVATSCGLGYLGVGLVRGYTAQAVPSLNATAPELIPGTEETSWLCAGAPLGAVLGGLVAGPILAKCGRRGALLVAGPVFAAAWFSMAAAKSFALLLASRILTGVAVGVVLPAAQIYIAECSSTSVRGLLGSVPSAMLAAGILGSYTVGAALPWDGLAAVSAGAPVLMALLLVPLPESPAWLAVANRPDDATAAAKWLNIAPDDYLSESKEVTAEDAPPLLSSRVMRPLALAGGLLLLQQASGVDAVVFYAVSILQDAGSTDAGTATLAIGAVQLGFTILSLALVDRLGRRPLLLISAIIMAASMAIIAIYYQLREDGQAMWAGLPGYALVTFVAGYSTGFGPVPHLLLGEMLPLGRRSGLAAACGTLNLGAVFLVVKTYPSLRQTLGGHIFSLYSASCVLAAFIVALFLPETKGKTPAEIEAFFVPPEPVKEKYTIKSAEAGL